jgi:predicted N-acetyltransferase YhbS
MEIRQIPNSEVPDTLALEALALEEATWPPKVPDTRSATARIQAYRERSEGRQAFFAITDQLVGYAEIFPRTVYTDNGPLEIMGLGSVCVSEESRGLGLGKKIVLACFKAVDQSYIDVCLFQTGVPAFYEKLNCKLVDNRFINKKNTEDTGKNPFWDDYTMIYPTSYNWPAGIIDLNGPGY